MAGIVFAVAGCGSSSDNATTSTASDLETWAGDVCTAVVKYQASLAATRATLRAENLSRPALQVAVENASGATREFSDALEWALGLDGPSVIEVRIDVESYSATVFD